MLTKSLTLASLRYIFPCLQIRVKEPISGYGNHTYADYLSWQLDEMVELIRGSVFRQAAAAPRRVHQEISMALSNKLYEFLKGKTCKVYVAPFDVRLPVSSRRHEDIDTVVQPNLGGMPSCSSFSSSSCIRSISSRHGHWFHLLVFKHIFRQVKANRRLIGADLRHPRKAKKTNKQRSNCSFHDSWG